MFRPRVIPVLLLKDKGLVKTIKFEKSKAKYIGDPINAVRIFNDLEADELIFLDIMATNKGNSIGVDLVKAIGDEAFMPFAVGGGIYNIETVKRLINAGAEKVVLNSSSFNDSLLIKQAADAFGNQSIIASIDIKKNIFGKHKIYINCGTKQIDKDYIEHIQEMQELGAGEIFVNSIDRDGTMEGYDIQLIRAISDAVSVPVIACGGAGQLSDFRKATKEGHASAVAAGSLFVYHGPRKAVLINYPGRNDLDILFS